LEVFIIKKQLTFLLVGLLLVILVGNKWIKKGMGLVSIILIIIAFHIMIRSQSLFTFYFKRQVEIPSIKNISNTYQQIPLFFAEIKKGNYGGYQLNEKNSQILEQMKKDLKEKTLFVYPSNVSIYEALGKKPPIRYLYFNNEYTKQMENETIEMLSNQKIEYVLVSYELTKTEAIVPNQTKRIEEFINKNYIKEKEYAFGNDSMVLMKIKMIKLDIKN
jgi:hypothetical protein